MLRPASPAPMRSRSWRRHLTGWSRPARTVAARRLRRLRLAARQPARPASAQGRGGPPAAAGRLAGLDTEVTVEALPGDADGQPDAGLGWRTRVQFAVREDGVAGLRAHRSHEVIDIGRCLIAHPAITDLGLTGRAVGGRWPPSRPSSRRGRGSEPSSSRGRSKLVAGGETSGSARSGRRLRGPAAAPPGSGLTPLRGRPYLSQHAAGRTGGSAGAAFWQVHPGAADALAGAVTAWARSAARRRGARPVLRRGPVRRRAGPGRRAERTVIGVEADQAAVRDARHNLREWPWARVHRGDVAALVRRGRRAGRAAGGQAGGGRPAEVGAGPGGRRVPRRGPRTAPSDSRTCRAIRRPWPAISGCGARLGAARPPRVRRVPDDPPRRMRRQPRRGGRVREETGRGRRGAPDRSAAVGDGGAGQEPGWAGARLPCDVVAEPGDAASAGPRLPGYAAPWRRSAGRARTAGSGW